MTLRRVLTAAVAVLASVIFTTLAFAASPNQEAKPLRIEHVAAAAPPNAIEAGAHAVAGRTYIAKLLANMRAAAIRKAALAWIAALPEPPPVVVHHHDTYRTGGTPLVANPTHVAPGSYTSVMQCIKDHESGVYTRNNHGYSGASGAYQIIGSTWRVWTARAGYGGYGAAYLAPPYVQDAVVVFMLANGGAHNWDMSYGNDPCTEGLP